jgi:hypothetical protein
MRFAVSLAAGLCAVAMLPGCADGSWSDRAENAVAVAGLMEVGDRDRPFTAGQLRAALAVYAGDQPAVKVSSGRLTMARFHRALVQQAGLADVASLVQLEAARAGLRPPRRFGTEVVARQLGFRVDHPEGQEQLERYPWNPVPRSEAAWSLARLLDLDGSQQAFAREVLTQLKIPRLTSRQRKPLRLAVSKIGMPYIWGGEGDGTRGADGPQGHGGYDCSGFVWRVFKMSGNPAGRGISGRTAADQALEIPRERRLTLDQVRPGDLLFFQNKKEIDHEGIALSKDFMIHASSAGGGVYLAPLFEPRRAETFRWGRRVL